MKKELLEDAEIGSWWQREDGHVGCLIGRQDHFGGVICYFDMLDGGGNLEKFDRDVHDNHEKWCGPNRHCTWVNGLGGDGMNMTHPAASPYTECPY